MKHWSQSSISIYKYLSTMTNTIDKLVEDMGKTSNSTLLQKQQSTYYQASKIIELMDRKRKMINLKVIVEDVIAKMDMVNRKIITLVYIDGVKSEMVARLLGVSIRTFFRKKLKAMQQLTNLMVEVGYDSEFFENEYFGEKWFMAVYDECVLKTSESEEILDKYLVKKVLNEVSRINMNYNTYLV